MIYRLKEIRLEKGFNQKEIAKKINLTQQTYSDYETGRTNPDIDTLIKIADILETTVDYLLGRSDDFGNVTVQQKSPASELTPAEQELLDNFRSLPRAEQAQANEYVRFIAERRGIKKNKGA